MKRGLSLLSEKEHSQISLLKKARPEEEELPTIVNFVVTTPILPQKQGYSLPLMSIATKWGCSQYAPNLFAANIIKIRDAVSTSTVLLFLSGVMVVVSGQSIEHARNMSQFVRLNVERTTCAMYNAEEERVYSGTLSGRTTFSKCAIHNIVGHGSVGMRINLEHMVRGAPECWKWFPDLFPGAKGKIWLTQDGKCACEAGEQGANRRLKCKCTIKLIMFDTGKMVITGGRTVQTINESFKRIRQLAPSFESANQENVPREDRFVERLNTMMVPANKTLKAPKLVERKQLKEEEVLACILSGVHVAPEESLPAQLKKDEGATPLMKMAEAGRETEVDMMLMMDDTAHWGKDARGRTALERLISLKEKTPVIVRLIEKISKLKAQE